MELALTLDRAGACYPASFVRAACGSLDHAIDGVGALAERERPPSLVSADGTIEHLSLVDGRGTGVFALRRTGKLAIRGIYRSTGEFEERPNADASVSIATGPDLGWDLVSSPDAARLAQGDVAAALLARALCRIRWIHVRSRTRWGASPAAAALIVRLLRAGQPAPELAQVGATTLDQLVAECLMGLGWHPVPGDSSFGTDPAFASTSRN